MSEDEMLNCENYCIGSWPVANDSQEVAKRVEEVMGTGNRQWNDSVSSSDLYKKNSDRTYIAVPTMEKTYRGSLTKNGKMIWKFNEME